MSRVFGSGIEVGGRQWGKVIDISFGGRRRKVRLRDIVHSRSNDVGASR